MWTFSRLTFSIVSETSSLSSCIRSSELSLMFFWHTLQMNEQSDGGLEGLIVALIDLTRDVRGILGGEEDCLGVEDEDANIMGVEEGVRGAW